MPKYRWIMFDADGTLFDFDRSEESALEETFRKAGFSYTAETIDRHRWISSRLWAEYELGRVSSERLRVARFERLFDELEVVTDAARFSEEYLANLGQQAHLIPGALAVVERLAEGINLLLATNGIASVQRERIERSPIRVFFSRVVISDEVGAAKPAPEFFARAFTEMGNPARSEVLVVGDSLAADIAGGCAFGLDTCWYNPRRLAVDGGARPSFEIEALDELYSIAERA